VVGKQVLVTDSTDGVAIENDRGALTLHDGGGEPIRITNYTGAIPDGTDVKERSAFVRAAGAAQINLDEDALHTVARALTSPGTAAAIVKQGLLTTEVIGPVNLALLSGHAFLTEVVPLLQPRASGYAYSVDPPRVGGNVGEAGPAAEVTLTFRNEQHLHDFMVQTVEQTIAHGDDYSPSILAKKVARPILTHVVDVRFEDGAESFKVLAVRDGITRVVCSWKAQQPALTPAQLGAFMSGKLLARKPVRAAAANETVRRARGRDDVAQGMRGVFVAGAAGQTPSEAAIRIAQTFTLPVQICLDLEEHAPSSVAAEARFEDTVQAVISSIHGEFKPWEDAAVESSAIMRAIPRAVHTQHLGADVAELAVGARGVEDMPNVFGPKAPATPLWRGVYLAAWLGHPYEMAGIKQHLRELTGARSITNKAFVSYMATVFDLPWRRYKAATERQARRAWANGGPLPREVLNTNWDPVPTDDFLTLVEPALAKEKNARNTLMVAGGVALVADKLLMSNVGSALSGGQVPFRANVDTVIEGLAQSEYGLCLLAHAANAFDHTRPAVNSFTPKELSANPALSTNTYVIPRPDVDAPYEVARDKARQIEHLTLYDVVWASNPRRAADEADDSADEDVEESGPQRAARLRQRVVAHASDAVDAAKELVKLAANDGAIVGGAFGDVETYRTVDELVRHLQLIVLTNVTSEPSEPADEAGVE
jgi:hypothetical protein